MKYNIEAIKKRNQEINLIKKISQRIAFVLTIVLIYNIFLVLKSELNNNQDKTLFGYEAYIVTTESMKPNINEGDVIITAKCNEEKLKIGDVITFKKNNETITHRIVSIEKIGNKKRYTTKGDNNNIEDSEKITYNEINGIQVVLIPYLGKIIVFLQNKIFVIIIVILCLISYLYYTKKEEKRKMRREKKKIEEQKNNNISDNK